MLKRCGKCKKEFESMGENDNWCTPCVKTIPKDVWEKMEAKNEKVMRNKIEYDTCPKCGDEYVDILGVGKCGECFDKIKQLYKK